MFQLNVSTIVVSREVRTLNYFLRIGFWLTEVVEWPWLWSLQYKTMLFMKWICDHRSESQFKQLRNSPKKKFFGASTGFEPVASALALQCSTSLSYEDPYTGGWPIYWVHQPVKGMKHSMKWCELREYMKWICDHRSESQFKQLRNSPKKSFAGLQRDSNPWPLR